MARHKKNHNTDMLYRVPLNTEALNIQMSRGEFILRVCTPRISLMAAINIMPCRWHVDDYAQLSVQENTERDDNVHEIE